MNELNVSRNSLDANAVDVNALSEFVTNLSSNIGGVGIAPDYSNNQLRNPVTDPFPLVTWLRQTALSAQIRNGASRGLAAIHQDADGNWVLMLPYTVGTKEPTATPNACCWVPLDIAKCGDEVPIRMLCLKDCDNILPNLINAGRRAGSNDLIGYFMRPGESVRQARRRMARTSMAYFTARNMILGLTTAETGFLKPFHGLLEVMEDVTVPHFLGTDILATFARLGCRLSILGGSNYIFAANPIMINTIAEAVQPGQFNTLPTGWTKSADGSVSFMGIRFLADKSIPVDLENGTGEIWLLNGNFVGAYMGTDLTVTNNDFIREGFTSTDDPNNGCASECTYYYNYGTVFKTNPNYLAVIQDVPISANCAGEALVGIDHLITPDTLVPMD